MEIMGLNIGLPEAYILTSYGYSALRASFNHGKILERPYFSGYFKSFVAFPLALFFGGFFDAIGIPQILYLSAYTFVAFVGATALCLWAYGKLSAKEAKKKLKEKRRKPVDAPQSILLIFLNLVILYWGGLFA